jgi:hypothetical protein
MSVGVIVGTVLLTIGITRLVEYAIYDKKQSDKGVWKNDEEIPTVAMEEV